MLRETETLLKAAADRTRLRILAMLGDQPLCVCQVVEVLGLSQSTVSKHLSLLVQAGLALDERRGKWTYYSLAPQARGGPGAKLMELVRAGLEDDPAVEKDVKKTCCGKVKRMVAKVLPARPGVRSGVEA
jgi:DNA-binding transcriptional ArsR family regulator